MRELITVQIGSYANYVGSHFWNIQDEAISCGQLADWSSLASTLDSEVVCSWSEDRHGEASYRPRAVLVDVSGSLGGVSFSPDAGHAGSAAAAAAAASQAGAWAGALEVHQLGQTTKSRFRQQLEAAGQADADEAEDEAAQDAVQQALEEAAWELHTAQHTPKFWTDYLQVDLQPDSVLMLSGAWPGQAGWQGWGVPGGSTSATRELVDATVDRVRWWAEQCDHMQGLQLLADDHGGWGGVCRSVLQELRDQYRSQPLLYFSLQQQHWTQQQARGTATPGDSATAMRWLLANALSIFEAHSLVSLYVPLSAVGHPAAAAAAGGGAADGKFQSAALLAAAIDTITLPLRCTGARSAAGGVVGATDLHSMVHLLADCFPGPEANLAAASLQLPAGCLQADGASGSTPNRQQPGSSSSSSGAISWHGGSSLTPGVSLAAEHCFAESLSLRGAGGCAESLVCSTSAAKQALDALALQRQQACPAVRCVVHSCISPMPLAAPLSFPSSLVMLPPRHQGGAAAAAAAHGPPSPSGPPAVSAAAATAGSAARPFLPRSAKAAAVRAPGAFSRLTASSGFEQVLTAVADSMLRLGKSAAGRACLAEWGYDHCCDADGMYEDLMDTAYQYSQRR